MPPVSDIRDRPGQDLWIIGFGNPHRRDDGVGPDVAQRLDLALGQRKDIQIRVLHQLMPELMEELQQAGLILFIDAIASVVKGGVKWTEMTPEFRPLYHVTHLFTPGLILGGMAAIFGRSPKAWLVSVQGENFDFGEGLTPLARTRAMQAASEITAFLERFNPYLKGEDHDDAFHTHHRR